MTDATINNAALDTDPRCGALDVPGARLYFELRGLGPLFALIGAPMTADAFAPLADALAIDHTVLTCDPRGVGRSEVDDPDTDSTPELRANDLAHLIEEVGVGPATVFGSSGGAVTALALIQQRPELVSALIAHEPPLEKLLADRDEQHAITEDVCVTYLSGDILGGWRKFLAQAGITMPPEALEQYFGPNRDSQTLADEKYWFAHELRPTTWWTPNLDALRNTSARIIVGIGEDSTDQICDHTARALATELRLIPTKFPGDHTGFTTEPHAFANILKGSLARESR